MLNVKEVVKGEVGVLIGRFQVPELHQGHRELIDSVRERHKRVLILVCSTPDVKLSRRNPLDYYTRMLMIQEKYPDVAILPLYDEPTDDGWSRTVDKRIVECFGTVKATLYGSRDAFIPYYNGKHETIELAASVKLSGTEIRQEVSEEIRKHHEFRRGVIYAAFSRYPVAFPTVDVAAIKYDREHGKRYVLLGKREKDNGAWRFPGGFVDPTRDKSLEAAAIREFHEEVKNADVTGCYFVGSFRVNDWRYRNEVDSIYTSLFTVNYSFGQPEAADDLDDVMWWDVAYADRVLIDEHKPLLEGLISYLNKKG